MNKLLPPMLVVGMAFLSADSAPAEIDQPPNLEEVDSRQVGRLAMPEGINISGYLYSPDGRCTVEVIDGLDSQDNPEIMIGLVGLSENMTSRVLGGPEVFTRTAHGSIDLGSDLRHTLRPGLPGDVAVGQLASKACDHFYDRTS